MNEKFFSLPTEKQEALINAGFRVFSQNSYKRSPVSEIAEGVDIIANGSLDMKMLSFGMIYAVIGICTAYWKYCGKDIQ